MWAGLFAFTLIGTASAHDVDHTWHFDYARVGELTTGWSAAKTGAGNGSVWRVVVDETAPSGRQVLAQVSSEGPNPLFNLCVADRPQLADVEIKAVTVRLDQGGGPVWRYQDENNYYVARHNPPENNYRVYKVVDGKHTQLATADVDFPAGVWHTLRVVQRGNHIQCFLNDELRLDIRDDAFPQAGRVGLWTKADAVTPFDDFHVQQLVP